MNKQFVESTLSVLGEAPNQWTTLYNKVRTMNFISDGVITVDPKYKLFYFDTTNNFIYIMNLTGEIYKISAIEEAPEGYIKIKINNNFYINKIAPYGITANIGGNFYKIHTILSFDKLAGIHNDVNIPLEDIIK